MTLIFSDGALVTVGDSLATCIEGTYCNTGDFKVLMPCAFTAFLTGVTNSTGGTSPPNGRCILCSAMNGLVLETEQGTGCDRFGQDVDVPAIENPMGETGQNPPGCDFDPPNQGVARINSITFLNRLAAGGATRELVALAQITAKAGQLTAQSWEAETVVDSTPAGVCKEVNLYDSLPLVLADDTSISGLLSCNRNFGGSPPIAPFTITIDAVA